MSILNTVEVTASIAGKEYHFISLELRQAFNKHHFFEIEINHEEIEKIWMDNPFPTIKLIGETVNISMKHKTTGETNLFAGIVTNVSFKGRHGSQNNIVISGASPTILLDGARAMDSFVDKNINLIVKEVVETSGNGADVKIDSAYSDILPYACQYNESAFEFMNRLSWEYGERFFYTGTQIYFGKQELHNPVDVTYDSELTHFEMSASLVSQKFNRFDYIVKNDHETEASAPAFNMIRGVRGFLQAALDKGDSVYKTGGGLAPLRGHAGDRGKLQELAQVEKARKVAEGLIFKGESQTCKIQIGKPVRIMLPAHMKVTHDEVDKFLITEVTHRVSQEGYYTNTFKGILDGIENVPMEEVPPVNAGAEIATVMDNADESGRIKVQFQWQKKVNKSTNWIRVQSMDAGQSDAVKTNRGMVFIPEIGDRVMVGFEYGDPSRPFSMGSIFATQVGKGGGEKNAKRSIITKTGHTIEFNDGKENQGITIKDPNKNLIHIDTANNNITITASNNVTINAAETMTFNATDIIMNAKGSIEMQAEASIKADAMAEVHIGAQSGVDIATESNMQLKAMGSTTIESQGELQATAQTIKVKSGSSLELSGMETKVKGQTTTVSGAGHKIEII